MPGSFMSRVFGRKKKQSLSPNKHNQGDTSQDRTIQEENRQGQSNGDNEDSYSQNENNSRLPEETLPIRNDDEVQGTTKIAAQDLWKEAFGNLEQQQNDLMEKFKDLMTLKLNAMGHSKSGELSAQDDWDNMEKFISSQAANVLSPKKEKFYNRVDEAFRILKGIIEMINEPIKLIPQAAAPWAGVNIAVTVSQYYPRCIALLSYVSITNAIEVVFQSSDGAQIKLGGHSNSFRKTSLVPRNCRASLPEVRRGTFDVTTTNVAS